MKRANEYGKLTLYDTIRTTYRYMQHPQPENVDEPALSSSLENCKMHRIKWEATIDGKVTLAPESGSLPVKGTTVHWKLKDSNDENAKVVIGGKHEITDDSGSFSIVVNELLQDFKNDVRYPIELQFEKYTESSEPITKLFGPPETSEIASFAEATEFCQLKLGRDGHVQSDIAALNQKILATGDYQSAYTYQTFREDRLYDIVLDSTSDLNTSPTPTKDLLWLLCSSSSIRHKFLCDGGTMDCSVAPTQVFIRHLDFDVPFVAIDDTTVPFTGKVVVGNTGGDATEGVGVGDGCPIKGVNVCLKDKHQTLGDTPGICVETDSLGVYELPAVIGTRVTVELVYKEHTFVPLDPSNRQKYKDGILIKADGDYGNNNFQDTTRTTLRVQVAGGLCDLPLGVSTVEIGIIGCDWEMDREQVCFSHVFWTGASC